MNKPLPSEYQAFYGNYVNTVQVLDGITALEESRDTFLALLNSISEEKAMFRYAPEKWSIKDIIQHLIDAEIVFTYRAMRIARADKTPLAGFEQDDYVVTANADYKSLAELSALFAVTRNFTISLFKSFSHSVHENLGTVNESDMSVRAIGFIISGHTMHHQKVIKDRYL